MLDNKYGLLKDVKLNVHVEFGSTKKSLEEIADLAVNSLITLDPWAGMPLKLYVNDKLVGTCEAVVINEHYGVKIISLNSEES